MLPAPLKVPSNVARRFHRRAVLLDTPLPGIDEALTHHGYIQIDPINVCGRMHDHILRNRVIGYREGDLMRHLHGAGNTRPQTPDSQPGARIPKPASARMAFEHHLPHNNVLVAFTPEAWPHLQAEMRARTRRTGAWSGRLTPREHVLAERLLGEIGERGPLASEDFDDNSRRARRVWGTATLVKSTLQKLFFHGRLLIAQRFNNRRRYDLPERVLPATVLGQPETSPAETTRWLALLKLRQRRLTTLKRNELRVVEDAVQPVAIEGLPAGLRCPTLYCLREDVALLESMHSDRAAPDPLVSGRTSRPLLLAPLDPLIYDRVVTSRLWGFDYTWEVYTPPARRKRGYYTLPVLAGTELVGHVEPKIDRHRRRLTIASRSVRRGNKVATALKELAEFLHLCRR